MKVFLSWSGEHAKKLAALLMDWLPNVIQTVEPWTSEEIGKGTRWSEEIARELEESRFGILCVDREHLTSPWIHFEAGAIAKSVQGATARNRVTPLLLGIDEADLRDPLALFQATKLEKEDMFRLVRSLNEVQDAPLDVVRLTKAFDRWWPELESRIVDLEATATAAQEPPGKQGSETDRSSGEVLEEVLHLLRDQRRAVTRLEQSLPTERSSWRADWPPFTRDTPEAQAARTEAVQGKLLTLGLQIKSIEWLANRLVEVALEDPPSNPALSDFGRWAAENRLEVVLKYPSGATRVGILTGGPR